MNNPNLRRVCTEGKNFALPDTLGLSTPPKTTKEMSQNINFFRAKNETYQD